MTRRQHRQWKKKHLEALKNQPKLAQDRPEWADDDAEEVSNVLWLKRFKEEVKAAQALMNIERVFN